MLRKIKAPILPLSLDQASSSVSDLPSAAMSW